MNQQQEPRTVSVDEIPIAPANTVTGDVDSADVPEGIRSITKELASPQPPTNPLVVLKAARWWYVHGRGTQEPVFRWAIEWTRHLATDHPPDVHLYDTFLDRLVEAFVLKMAAAIGRIGLVKRSYNRSRNHSN